MAKSPLMKLLKKAIRDSQEFLSNPSRRQFIKSSAAVSASLWTPIAWAQNPKAKVGIIGAGASGLACAYALTKAQVPFQIFEGSERVGGRILTSDNWNTDRQFIEIGGELLDSSHHTIFELVKTLALNEQAALKKGKKFSPSDLEVLRFSDAEKNNLEKAIIYVDQKVYKEKELIQGIKPLVRKTLALRNQVFKNQKETLYYSNREKFPEAVKMDHRSIRELFETFNGVAENWVLKTVISAYESEFGREAENQSSLNYLSLMDDTLADGFSMFGESDEALRLKKGNSSLVRGLLNFLSDYGSKSIDSFLTTGSVLTGLVKKGNEYHCKFKGKPDQVFTHLVVTLPFSILRKIEGLETLNLSAEKRLMIQNLGTASNSKAMIDFKNKFWRTAGKIANQGEHYVHENSQVLWETSRMQKGSHGILTNFIGGIDADNADSTRPEKSLILLSKIYGESVRKSHTGKSIFMDWQKNPWSQGSYAVLKPGQYSQFWGSGPIAENNNSLIFAGEHTSLEFQGFMNGAYESGLRAARQLLSRIS